MREAKHAPRPRSIAPRRRRREKSLVNPDPALPPGRAQLAGIALVMLSAAAFGISPVGARLAFEAGSNTLTVVTLRAMIGVVVLGLVLGIGARAARPGPGALRLSLLAGLASAAVSYGFIGSVAYIPVSLGLLLFFTHPLLIAALWHWQGRERLSPRKLALGLVVLAGLGLALGAGLGALDARGVALALMASAAMAGMIEWGARARALAGSAWVNLWVSAVTALLFGLAASLLGAWAFPGSWRGWAGVLLAGLGVTLGLFAFLAAFRYLSPVRATMLGNAEPLFGIGFAMLLLGEWLSAWQWAGVALVVAGLVAFEAPGRRRRNPGA
jgi:drug/metabolite transporter (DMT)-like permease